MDGESDKPSAAAAETIFIAALELPPDRRPDYLATACGDNQKLLQRVEALLCADEAPESFLPEQPGLVAAGPATAADFLAAQLTEQPGDLIVRYKLLEKLGEGGCGVVYMAEQEEPIRRKVALKVIKLGMDTRQVVGRFEAERQALALMDHPNIAKVLDAGATDTGRPYFVMELVGGIKITDYCEQNRLTTRQRLDLFIQVCHAIQHAHQKGVIHRDIKPSNILVTTQDGVAAPKVIDFGIAKATQGRLTDDTAFTAFELFLGTPAYMSPEQAQMGGLDIDTRSDIYSLGVLLYELLTGKTPFDAKELLAVGLEAMRRTIQEKEPPTPSTRFKQERLTQQSIGSGNSEIGNRKSEIQKDLDWIVMKCLEKDRARRYETTNGLARDIERHLNNEPVLARPPSKLYEFQKAVRRHKFGFAATAGIILVLAIGATISTWQAVRATQAEREQSRLVQQAKTAQANEALQRQKAEREAAKSKEIARFLEEMLSGAGPSVARGRDATMLREILDKTTERVEKDLKDQPEVQGDLNLRLALTYRDLGENKKAETLLQLTVEQYRGSVGSEHCKLAQALGLLGAIQSRLPISKVQAGKVNAEAGLDIARKCGDKRTLAACLYYRARSLHPWLNVVEEEPYLREAVSMQRELGDDPAVLAVYIRALAGCLDDTELFREALRIDRKHLGNDHPSVADDLYGLAQSLLLKSQLEEAGAAAKEAIEILWSINPKNTYRIHFFQSTLNDALIRQGKWAEAESEMRKAVERSPSTAHYWGRLADVEARRQNWPAAADLFSHAIELAAPEDYSMWGRLPATLLMSGRIEQYRKYCHGFLEQAQKGREFVPCERVAKFSLLMPVDGDDFVLACELADYVATATEPAFDLPVHASCKALAEYRRGKFDAAKSWALRASDTPDKPTKALAQFLLAMIHCQFQDINSAKGAMSSGAEIVKIEHPDPLDFGSRAEEWVAAEILRREAQQLLDIFDQKSVDPSK